MAKRCMLGEGTELQQLSSNYQPWLFRDNSWQRSCHQLLLTLFVTTLLDTVQTHTHTHLLTHICFHIALLGPYMPGPPQTGGLQAPPYGGQARLCRWHPLASWVCLAVFFLNVTFCGEQQDQGYEICIGTQCEQVSLQGIQDFSPWNSSLFFMFMYQEKKKEFESPPVHHVLPWVTN